jgi:hypothetical protein
MFIFLRLLLGHFIGDFPLQTDKIFTLKHRGFCGVIPHALLVTGSLLALSWPYLYLPEMWFFIICLGLLHLVQDSIKISYAKFTKYSFTLYVLDQCFHVGLIAALFFTHLKDLPAPKAINSFVSLYNNNFIIAYLIALLAATYNGFFLIRIFKMNFLRHAGQYTPFEKYYGMFERGSIVTLCVMPGFCLLWLPLILMRFALFLLNKKLRFAHRSFIRPREILLSWIIGIMAGMSLYFLSPSLYR